MYIGIKGIMRKTIKVSIGGEERALPANTQLSDLYKILGFSKWEILLLVNGKPRSDDSYLEDGDLVTWLRITLHESPVSESR
jgi:sulfur carrier protein ThiS